jgi:DNA-binding XRE family transcriptional regulator
LFQEGTCRVRSGKGSQKSKKKKEKIGGQKKMETRGAAMKRARQRAGLTQRALAKISGVHQQTINGLENGYVQGTIKVIEVLADALGISVDEYIGHVVTKSDGTDLERYFGLK